MTAEERKLRKIARAMFKNVEHVSHVLPRAYCVAKPAPQCAMFAVPPQDREPPVRDSLWVTVTGSSCDDVRACDWCALAYIMRKNGTGLYYVLTINK